MQRRWFRHACFGVFAGISVSATPCFADTTTTESDTTEISPLCPNSEILSGKMITGICWKCMLPMRVLGASIKKTVDLGLPEDSNTKPACTCAKLKDGEVQASMGISAGLWLPARIYEIVKQPFCSPFLNGTVIGKSSNTLDADGENSGISSIDMGGSRQKFTMEPGEITRYQVHAFAFPVLTMLQFVTEMNCLEGYASVDMVAAPTEFLPNWNDEELSLILAPESIVFGNALVQMSGGIDCVSSTAGYPLSDMFYVAGCWGLTYPLSGNISDPIDPIKETSLLMAKHILYQHRIGLYRRTFGTDAMCEDKPYEYTTPKSQYKFSALYPVADADADEGQKCCHSMGMHQWRWGLGNMLPGTGEDFVILEFNYHDCCLENFKL